MSRTEGGPLVRSHIQHWWPDCDLSDPIYLCLEIRLTFSTATGHEVVGRMWLSTRLSSLADGAKIAKQHLVSQTPSHNQWGNIAKLERTAQWSHR